MNINGVDMKPCTCGCTILDIDMDVYADIWRVVCTACGMQTSSMLSMSDLVNQWNSEVTRTQGELLLG